MLGFVPSHDPETDPLSDTTSSEECSHNETHMGLLFYPVSLF